MICILLHDSYKRFLTKAGIQLKKYVILITQLNLITMVMLFHWFDEIYDRGIENSIFFILLSNGYKSNYVAKF